MSQTHEEVLVEILEQSLAGYWDWDIPSGNEYLSPSFKQMFGYDDQEMENRVESWQKIIFQEDLPSVYEKFDQHVASKGEIPYYNEVRYYHKDGSTVWVICTGKVIEWDDQGNPLRMVGCHIDITARKSNEHKLAERVKELQLLHHLSKIVERHTISIDQLCQEWVTIIPEGWQYPALACARISVESRIFQSPNFIETDTRQTAPIKIAGKTVGCIDVCYREKPDTTFESLFLEEEQNLLDMISERLGHIIERKQVEEALEWNIRLMNETGEMAHVGGWEINVVTQTLIWTREVRRIHEVADDYTPTIQTAISFYTPSSQPIISEAVSEALEKGKPFDVELQIITARGNYRWVQALGKVVYKDDTPIAISGTLQDITDRKLIEESIKATHSRLQATLDALPDLLFEVDLEGRIYNYHTHRNDLLAAPPEVFIGKRFRDVLPIDAANLCKQAINEAHQNGFSSGLSMELEVPQGKHWFEISVARMDSTDQSDQHFIIISHDITKRKRAEQQISETKQFYETIIEGVQDGIWVTDEKDVIIFANKAMEEIAGIPRDQIQGNNVLHDFPKETTAELIDFYKKAKKDKKTTWYNIRVTTPSGRDTWQNGWLIPLYQLDSFVGIICTIRDVTAQQNARAELETSEQKFRNYVENAPYGIFIVDEKGDYLDVNEAAVEITGYSREELLHMNLRELVPVDEQNKAEEHFMTVATTGKANGDMSFVKKDGTSGYWDISASKLNDHRFLGFVTDITNRKKMEEELLKNQKLESLGVLAGGIAHDFNNLMGGVFGYIDLAKDEQDKQISMDYLSKAMNAIDRARALTAQLLTFAKGGHPIQKIEKLSPFIQETVEFALSGSNISCEFNIAPDLWHCSFDRNQIGQVLDNLIINAQQAMPLGGTIQVVAQNTSFEENEHPTLKKNTYVKISIIDKGIGISKELLPKIFDPFFSTKTKGHGLGLATCYSIINRHGGCIEVESTPNIGTTFHMYLPATIDEKESITIQPIAPHKGSGTILFMDDEEILRTLTKEILQTLGYEVVCTADGNEAIEFYAKALKENQHIVGMIFDLTVPGGMGGKEAVQAIRKLDTQIPVFVASGYAEDPIMKNPTAYGFTASLCKPFRRSELSEMLNTYMPQGDGL